MKRLWMMLETSAFQENIKNALFIIISSVVWLLLGAVLWLLVGRVILPGVEWLLCFMGYLGVFIGFLGSLLYLYNHQFSRV